MVKLFSFKATHPRGSVALFLVAFLLPVFTAGSSPALAQDAPACPAPGPLTRGIQGPLAYVRYLADDALEGREVGTTGAHCAAEYIAGTLRDLGLQGAEPDGSFFQTFPVRVGWALGSGNTLSLAARSLALGREWVPYGFSASASVDAELVYGGMGVSRPGARNDPYAQLDLEGMVVVVEAGDPHGSGGSTAAGDPRFKAAGAAERGAAGVLVLLPEGEELPEVSQEQRPAVNVPVAAVAGDLAAEIRSAAEDGRTIHLATAVEPSMAEARNVVALLPGANPGLRGEVVIVGAHYDHLGFGGEGSLAPDVHEVHNGADDNASGTAALMEIAGILSHADRKPARSVLFVAFTGEERGLWGSAHYVQDPIFSLDSTMAMMNMDMVGRLRDNTLTVYGTGTAQEWTDVLEEVNQEQAEPFTLAPIPDGFGPSDHSSFYAAHIPVLMLFTNTHAEYHRPEDDWQLINQQGLERVAGFGADIVREIAGSGTADVMALTLVEGAGNPHAGAMAAQDEEASRSSGYGAYMGTIPDMTPRDSGVRITGVREDSPAEKAGLKGGDVIVEFGGREITDLYAYTYALRDHAPGDEVEVVVLRDGERLSFTAVLESR